MTNIKKMPIRLAFRHEGNWWNVYLALPDTMKGARLIGSILMGVVTRDSARKEAFMALMKEALADAAEEVFGERPTEFGEEHAPEGERSGHA